MGWILVLTIMQAEGNAIATARFGSGRACVDAGNAWVNRMHRESPLTVGIYANCYQETK